MGTYDALVAAVGDWLDRDDLAARVPTFLRLAEARLNRILEDPDMEVTSTAAATGDSTALPADFGAMVSITTGNGALRPLSPVGFAGFDRSVTGEPRYYSVSNNAISLAPANSGVTFTMVYRRRIPALTAAAPSNWLLVRAPDVYFYAALLQAEAFLAEDDRIPLWKSAFDEALGELWTDGSKRRWGAGPIAPRVRRT